MRGLPFDYKYTPNEIQQRNLLKSNNRKVRDKLKKLREDYLEEVTEGLIKNCKAVIHKEQPEHKKAKLNPCNIKRPLKFSDVDIIDNTLLNTAG